MEKKLEDYPQSCNLSQGKTTFSGTRKQTTGTEKCKTITCKEKNSVHRGRSETTIDNCQVNHVRHVQCFASSEREHSVIRLAKKPEDRNFFYSSRKKALMNLLLRRFFSQVCMKTKRQGQRVRLSARNKEEVNKRNANYIPRIKRIAFKNVPRNFEIKWKDASFPAKRSEDEQNEESSTAKFRNKSCHLRKLLISGHSPTISQTESTLLVFRGGQRWHPNSYCNNTPKNSPGDSCADEEKLTLSGSPSCCTNCSFYEKYMTERLFSPSLLSSSADCSLFSSGAFSLSQAWALDQDENAAWKIYQPKESFYAPLHVLSMRFSLPPLRPTSAPAILKGSKVY